MSSASGSTRFGPAGGTAAAPRSTGPIRDRFGGLWEEVRAGRLAHWRTGPVERFAFILLTDQFSRNMFRNRPEAFATDPLALDAARKSINLRWDLRFPEPGRQFFYLPFSMPRTSPTRTAACGCS